MTAKDVPGKLSVVVAVALGLALGIGGFTFVYARGASYLTNDPATCINCHVMGPGHARWLGSSHHASAVCNDCHAPHDVVGKYVTKATNGVRHALAFTTGRFADSIQLKAESRDTTNRACESCHRGLVEMLMPASVRDSEITDCVRCHRMVGHVG